MTAKEIKDLSDQLHTLSDSITEKHNQQDIMRVKMKNDIEKILEQTIKTNGRVTTNEDKLGKVQKVMLVVGVIAVTLLVANGSELLQVFKIII